jgi:hypothetical protein
VAYIHVAKYVTSQDVVGVNPSPVLFPGVLVRHPPEAVRDLFATHERRSSLTRGRIGGRT